MLVARRRLSRVCLAALLLAGGLSLWLPDSARAANPGVTLQLQNATVEEALLALEKASGVPLQFKGEKAPAEERAGFNWSDVPPAEAMRALAARFDLRFQPLTPLGGYLVWKGQGNQPKKFSPVTTERKGVRLFVDEVPVRAHQTVYAGSIPAKNGSELSLQLSALIPGGDALSLYAVTNLTAKDDRGNALIGFSGERGIFSFEKQFPDQWFCAARFPGYDPRARKLAWLEGEIHQYRVLQETVLRIPLPLAAGAKQFEVGNLHVEVEKLDIPEPDKKETPSAEFHIRTPALLRAPLESDGGVPMRFTLIGASGKQYVANVGSTRFYDKPHEDTADMDRGWNFGVPEEVTALEIRAVERKDPQVLTTFRIEDIPLPKGGVFIQRRQDAPRRAQPLNQHAFFDFEGGSLSGAVKIPAALAPRELIGEVAYGLAPMVAEKTSPTRWMEARLTADGTAKLEHVKPGRYRVLRLYRPDESFSLPQPGRWLHAEETVEISAGKETVLPTLEWSPATKSPVLPSK